MIFGIDSSIIDTLKMPDSDNYLDSILLIEKLGTIFREGKHLIDLSRTDLEEILKHSQELSLHVRKTYYFIKKYFSTLGINEIFKKKAIITLTLKDIVEKDDKYYIPMKYAIVEDFFNVNFITEDITDKDFFSYIAKCVAKKNSKLNGIKISSVFKNGGGDRCSLILEDSCKIPSITISIIDSDIKYPGCVLGETAKKVKKLEIKNSIFEPKFLNIREVENLIPIDFFLLHDSYKKNIDKQIIKFYDKNDFYKYFDFKEGLTRKKLLKCLKKKKYWENILEYKIDLKTLNLEEEEIFIRGLGNSILKNFNDSSDILRISSLISLKKSITKNPGIEKNIKNLEEQLKFFKNPLDYLNEELKSEWMDIGLFLLNWTSGIDVHIS